MSREDATADEIIDYIRELAKLWERKEQRYANDDKYSQAADAKTIRIELEGIVSVFCKHKVWHDTNHAGRICDDCGEEVTRS